MRIVLDIDINISNKHYGNPVKHIDGQFPLSVVVRGKVDRFSYLLVVSPAASSTHTPLLTGIKVACDLRNVALFTSYPKDPGLDASPPASYTLIPNLDTVTSMCCVHLHIGRPLSLLLGTTSSTNALLSETALKSTYHHTVSSACVPPISRFSYVVSWRLLVKKYLQGI